jgi:lycopene cyclase domain-containing protein
LQSKYLYLALNIASFIIPFAFSFYPKANFSKKWKYVLPAILATAIVFIAWDVLFTKAGVWGFNPFPSG